MGGEPGHTPGAARLIRGARMQQITGGVTTRRRIALLALVAVMVVWGSTFVVTKAAMREFPPLTLAFLRFAIATMVLAPLMRRSALVELRRSASTGRLLFLAFTGIALFTAAFNFALVYGSAAQGALLYATIPAVVAICAVLFLKERLSRRRIFGIALSMAGAALIVASGEAGAGDAPAPLLAAALMLFTVVLWGAYTVVAKPIAAANQSAVTFALSAIGALLLLPPSAFEIAALGWPTATAQGWVGVIYLAVFASAGAYALYNFALRELDASTVGAFTNIDPLVGVMTAFLFLGETLSPVQFGGAAIVIVGMWLASTEARRAPSRRQNSRAT
jgi:drug/metabolite transporter (DMT)-like permease